MSKFFDQVRAFNEMYGLPRPPMPQLLNRSPGDTLERLKRFKEILQDELNEIDDIIVKISTPSGYNTAEQLLTDLADWLADMQVYCASEAVRFGLDNDVILDVVMQSNFSKLGADGKPIVQDGKVVKGPNYWKPEPKLYEYICKARAAPHPVTPNPTTVDAREQIAPQTAQTAQGPIQAANPINGRQVEGSYYQTAEGVPQHWDLTVMYKWDPFQYQITKYLMRWKGKHPTPETKLKDLLKAQHFLEKYISVYREFLPQPSVVGTDLPLGSLHDPQSHNEWWTNEGYYGDGTCLYKCRHCKSEKRTTAPGGPHGCAVGQQANKAS